MCPDVLKCLVFEFRVFYFLQLVIICQLRLLYLGLLSAVAYTVWSILLKHNPVSRVTVFGFLNPVFGVLLSALLLGEVAEAFAVKNLAALALVSLGIYIINAQFKNSVSE